MLEVTLEVILSWAFVCWKILNHSFHFITLIAVSFFTTLLHYFPLHYLWLVFAYFLFLPGSVLEVFTFLRMCPFLQVCPFYWLLLASYDPRYFCGVGCNFFFISDFTDVSLFSVFLDDLSTVCQFSLFSWKPTFNIFNLLF